MSRVTSIEELSNLKSKIETERKFTKQVLICGGTGCISSGSNEIADKMTEKVKAAGKENEIRVIKTGCFGFCEKGPIVKMLPDNTFYTEVTPEDADRLVETHLLKEEKIEELLFVDPVTKNKISDSDHMDFYKKQERVALRNCGVIDPENIEDYLLHDGYTALDKVLKMSQQEVVDIMKDSGLRGRGGGGFPTGLKWQFALNNVSDQKYVVCNADEGDPGAFMDRSILEGDPHSVVEAMAICGYSIGSNHGLVY
ncbi:MAG: NAD(P)H-dependent oxidoreductase subunit E, partial [Leptotrichiaceae bacterium]